MLSISKVVEMFKFKMILLMITTRSSSIFEFEYPSTQDG